MCLSGAWGVDGGGGHSSGVGVCCTIQGLFHTPHPQRLNLKSESQLPRGGVGSTLR